MSSKPYTLSISDYEFDDILLGLERLAAVAERQVKVASEQPHAEVTLERARKRRLQILMTLNMLRKVREHDDIGDDPEETV